MPDISQLLVRVETVRADLQSLQLTVPPPVPPSPPLFQHTPQRAETPDTAAAAAAADAATLTAQEAKIEELKRVVRQLMDVVSSQQAYIAQLEASARSSAAV